VVVRWSGPALPGLDPATAVARLRAAGAGARGPGVPALRR
jgi:hypothetical protein